MGSRAQVKIESTGVYLYTHWGAEEIATDVQKALARNQRWDDDEYLTRIIFDALTGPGAHGEETGFGIGTEQHGDIECLVTVDTDKATVTVDRSMCGGNAPLTASFAEFITQS